MTYFLTIVCTVVDTRFFLSADNENEYSYAHNIYVVCTHLCKQILFPMIGLSWDIQTFGLLQNVINRVLGRVFNDYDLHRRHRKNVFGGNTVP